MPSKTISRAYTVTGDPGSVFSLKVTNEDNHYYNFPENTEILNEETQSAPAAVFSATEVRLKPITIDATGEYNGVISFPKVTDDDYYDISLMAEGHYDTLLSDELGGGLHYYLPRINRFLDTTVTFSLLSAAQEYNSYPSNVTAVGIDTKANAITSPTSFSISWNVTLSSSDFIIARQPVDTDFEFTTTKDTLTAGTSATSLELKDISGLSVGMSVSGTGIASGATIVSITKGYYDETNSTSIFPKYNIPLVANSNNTSLEESDGGTVVISAASTFVVDRTLTFTGKGANASKFFNNTDFKVSNFTLVLADVVTTTDAAVSNSTTIPITSTDGIKAAETTLIKGIGVSISAPHVDAVSNGVNVTASSAQTIENGQTVTFTGSSRSATITADVDVASYGDSNITLTLALDNILTVS